MSKKGKNMYESERVADNTKYIKVQIDDEMKKSFISYAMAVNISRAIPDVRDGLKPVQRRILYDMGELGLGHDKPHKKCARIVGDVMGKFHPHGDSSIYMALVRMAQPFSMRYPLVDGQGNFGSVDNDPPAAQRYTEARMSSLASYMLKEIDKETVDFFPNFDESLEQPTVLPARFPNLLVNGSDGIAVGMATNIPPHNLSEVIDGVVALIDNPDIDIDELIRIIPAPDYPTGGIIMNRTAVKLAYRTGRGGIVIRARAEIEEHPVSKDSTQMRQRIVVTELPYQVNKAQLIENVAEMVKDKRLEGISDLRDESDRTGLKIVFEIKRDAQANIVLNMLYKHTSLQVSGGIIFLSLVNGEPKILNLKEMLTYYLEHQKEVVARRTKYDLNKAEEKAHILEGLVKALANIDKVVAIIKASRDKFEASERLMQEFFLTDKQSNAILEMRLQRLTSLEVESLQRDLEEISRLITEYKAILADPQKVLDIVKAELLDVKEKFGDERRTEISMDFAEGGIDIADLIEREDVVVSVTHFGYIKRLALSEYRSQKRGGKGITAHKPKEEDFVENIFVTSTHDDLMFFTNMGRVYTVKGYQIPEAQRQARGRAIINLLELTEGEKVTAFIPIKEDQIEGNLMMATKRGLVKKTALSEFSSIRKGGKIAINLLENDELISVQLTGGRDELLLASSEGKCIRFAEDNVRLMGRNTQGVRSIRLNEDDYVVDMTVLKSGYDILTVSTNGYGKRTDIEDYRLQSRGGKGIKAGIFNEKTGKLVNLKLINPEDDIMLISADGTIIRMHSKEISKIGRDTQGVRIMKIKGGTEVVCVTTSDPYEELAEE